MTTAEYNKICNIEAKVIRCLSWVFFLPVMLAFAAFKNTRFRVLLLTLSIITASLSVVLVYDFVIDNTYPVDPSILNASSKTAEFFEGLSVSANDAAVIPEESIVYVTKSGMKYHTAECYILKGNGIAKTYEDAVLLGYTPCKRCH